MTFAVTENGGVKVAKYKQCGHYSGECPCIDCGKECCTNYCDSDGNTVDTDILCAKAKAYCESGRSDNATD